MRAWLYALLVGRHPEIRERYLERRRADPGMGRLHAVLLLLRLNLFWLLFPSRRVPEQPLLPAKTGESACPLRKSPESLAEELAVYDVISFDVFDTLILRSTAAPEDLFDLMGAELGCPGFRDMRTAAEREARAEKQLSHGTPEVTLDEIWTVLERKSGIPQARGTACEWAWELRCCSTNPYMLAVVRLLARRGKTCIAASDMYLSREQITDLLRRCGYPGFQACFVSCDAGASKHSGTLYDVIRGHFGGKKRYCHLGDNRASDLEQAQRHEFAAHLYPGVGAVGMPFRVREMSPVTGSLYCGLVNSHIHCGTPVFSQEYEYGFIYGGLFAAGYCRFIHRVTQGQHIDKILFLARDGAVLLEAYRRMYPEERETTCYAYWSRPAAVKVTADHFREEYFRRFLLYRAGQGLSVRKALEGMELGDWADALLRAIKMDPESALTHKNAPRIQQYLLDRWPDVLARYRPQSDAARLYYSGLLSGCRSAAAVDIGWAGSGALMLDAAVNRDWGMDCPITGILAGTNTRSGPEPNGVEPFLFSGKLVSYLYSQQINRDLWGFHDPAQGHNLYWELLLSSEEGSLKGFYPDGDGSFRLAFRENRTNPDKIREIHRGILDFVDLFLDTERRLGMEIPVSGRDAYAPMLAVLSRKNKAFRRELEELLDEIHLS